MMISNTQESLLPTARSLHSRQGSPVKGSVNSFEGRLVTVLVLAVFIGVVTFWKVPGLPLPAVSPRQPQPALATNLAPVPVRRIRDVVPTTPHEKDIAYTQPEDVLFTQNDLLSTEDDPAFTERVQSNEQDQEQDEQNQEADGAQDTTDGEQGNPEDETNAAIKPMNAQELTEHEDLINDILRNGAPSRTPSRSAPAQPALHLHPVNIEQNISSKDFRMRYGSTFAVQPVLIRDSQNDWLNEQDWRMEAMMRDLKGILLFDESEEECRDGQPDRQSKDCHSIKERDPSLVGKEWASLTAVNLDLLGVSTYDELFPKQVELAKTGRYLYAHEISCSQLPQLGDRLYQPKYFRNNFNDLDSTNDPDGYQLMQGSHFPSFFFGPRGSTSPLHSDSGMTRFWILQLAGRKLVRLLPPSENSRASPTDWDMFLPTLFTADLLHPDFESHPGLNGAIVYEALLEPGDILHIPEGWAHQALNLDWSAMRATMFYPWDGCADIDDQARGNLMNYLEFDEPDDKFRSIVETSQFFLPLVNASRDLGNIPMHEYFESHALELAPVSDAAKDHVKFLRSVGLQPDQWHDYYSRSLLTVAVVNNYLQLAEWLVEQGMSLENTSPYRHLLKYTEMEGLQKMSLWLRDRMGVPVDDTLDDVLMEVKS